jgi:hypothetical protein
MRGAACLATACALLAVPSASAAQAPAAAPSAGARVDRVTFAYQRRIPRGAPGVARLRLDLAALSHSRLADIRLVSADGFQVPYLLEDDPDALRVTLPALTAVADPELSGRVSQLGGRHRSVYALALPLAKMPPCHLLLDTRARVFERGLSLLSRNDNPRGREPRRWETRAWETWRHSNPDEAAAPLVLTLPSIDSTDARVIVDEGDNQPLPLEPPVLEVRTCRLRFVRETGAELWLVYGRRDLGAPRYDLALLGYKLREEAATEVTAEPEPAADQRDEGRHSSPLFWGVLIAAVVALLALLVRLLRTPPDQHSQPN